MRISIVNWEKFNPRIDVRHPTWFRLQNTFWMDGVLFDLDSDGKMVWLVLLAMASQHQSGTIDANISMLSSILRVTEEKVEVTLKRLLAAKMIAKATSRGRHVGVTRTSRPRDSRASDLTDRQTDRQTRQTDRQTDTTHNFLIDAGAQAGARVMNPEKIEMRDFTQEARAIGRLIWMPVDHGEGGKPRFVDIMALDACMDDALKSHGIEVLRHLKTLVAGKGRLGDLMFDPNQMTHILDSCAKDLERVCEGQATV